MHTLSRNAPCACGSGLKHKKCCGTTRTSERAIVVELERMLAVMEQIALLPSSHPQLRPESEALMAWLDRVAAHERDASIDDAIALIGEDERTEIVGRCGRVEQVEWARLIGELGDESVACEALLAGGILAALRERAGPDPESLGLIEELDDVRDDPAQALSFALEGDDLWSFAESAAVDAALAAIPEHLDDNAYEIEWERVLAEEAERLCSDWHDRRLALLVERLRERLPLAELPIASTTLEAACDRFEHDPRLRRELAAALLSDTLSRVVFSGIAGRRAA